MKSLYENLVGDTYPSSRGSKCRFYNPDFCPAIEHLEPIVLLATTTWKDDVDQGNFADNANWNMGAPGANDTARFASEQGITVNFPNVAAAKGVLVTDVGGEVETTEVTFDLGQKTHSFEFLTVSNNGSNGNTLWIKNGTISSDAQHGVDDPNVAAFLGGIFHLEADAAVQGEHSWHNLTGSTMIIEGQVNNHTDGRTPGVLTASKGTVEIRGVQADARFSNVNIDGNNGLAKVLVENGALLEVEGAIKIGQQGRGELTLDENMAHAGPNAFVSAGEFQIGTPNFDPGGEVLVQAGTSIWVDSYAQFTTQTRSETKVTGENSSIVSGVFTLAGGDLIIDEGAKILTVTTGEVFGTNTAKVTVVGAGSRWDLGGNFTFGDPGGKKAEVLVSDGGIIESTGGNIVHRANGRLLGNSKVKANQIVSEDKAAWILPGLFPGDIYGLTLDGDWDASGGVTYFVDIDGTDGFTSDLIYVTGTAALGGILNVNLLGDTPIAGSEYLIVQSSGELSGTFDLEGSVLPELPPGLYWGADYGQVPNGAWYAKLVVFEPYLGVNLEIVQVDEGTSVAIFTFDLVNYEFLTQNVLVDYATADGSATAGDDYLAVSGTLTFSRLQTHQTVQVAIIDARIWKTSRISLCNSRTAALRTDDWSSSCIPRVSARFSTMTLNMSIESLKNLSTAGRARFVVTRLKDMKEIYGEGNHFW